MVQVQLTEVQEWTGTVWYYDRVRVEREVFHAEAGFTQPTWEELPERQRLEWRATFRLLVAVLNAAAGTG